MSAITVGNSLFLCNTNNHQTKLFCCTLCFYIRTSNFGAEAERSYWTDHERAISKADYNASSKPLFANLKILDVFSIYSLQVSSFMYLYHNGALPFSFTQSFQTGSQIHQYSTRYSHLYRPYTCRTNIKKFSILFQGPRIINMEFATKQH